MSAAAGSPSSTPLPARRCSRRTVREPVCRLVTTDRRLAIGPGGSQGGTSRATRRACPQFHLQGAQHLRGRSGFLQARGQRGRGGRRPPLSRCQALSASPRPTSLAEAIDDNVQLAERLWATRSPTCTSVDSGLASESHRGNGTGSTFRVQNVSTFHPCLSMSVSGFPMYRTSMPSFRSGSVTP